MVVKHEGTEIFPVEITKFHKTPPFTMEILIPVGIAERDVLRA